MKIMAANPHDSFSFSRRYFSWKRKAEDEDDEEDIVTFSSSSLQEQVRMEELNLSMHSLSLQAPKKKKLAMVAVSKLRSALTFGKSWSPNLTNLGSKVSVTLFGYRRGRVHFAFQEGPKLNPAFLVELPTPTSILVKEMASGLVRIALECVKNENKGTKLLKEPIWRTYCNGRKCGYATRRECGAEEQKVLNAVGPVTMGAGVLPEAGNGEGTDGELMYMRARFERVVGSKDSEAFYMINPDGHGGPELSIYLLRV